MSGLCDSFERPINYLRISVTDRCNLRCVYCMPPQGVSLLPREEMLSYEEICLISQAAAELGITKVRISGGEPLVREGLPRLVRQISAIKDIDDLSLTSNGILLEQYASELKRAGLRRINVSLDTLNRSRFQRISGFDKLEAVLRGIETARSVGLVPVKINMVVMRGVNDDELVDFARLSQERGWHVRFVELMPLVKAQCLNQRIAEEGGNSFPSCFSSLAPGSFVSAQEVRDILAPLGELEPCPPPLGNGPAKYYRLSGAKGTIGFITPVSDHFCFACNRLRLTAEGKLYPCLLGDEEIDLRGALRRGAAVVEIRQLIRQAVSLKPEKHHLAEGIVPRRAMSQIGG